MPEGLKKTGKIRIPKGARWLVGFALLPGLSYFCFYAYAWIQLQLALRDQAAAGLPTRMEELAPPVVADADNAALVYEEVFELMEQEGPEGERFRSDLERTREYWPGIDDDRTGFNEHAAILLKDEISITILAKMREARSKPACRFDLNYSLGYRISLPHLRGLREATIFEAIAARHMIHLKNYDDAWDHTLSILHLAHATGNEPILVSQLVRAMIANEGFDCLQEVIRVSTPTPKQREQLIAALERFEGWAPWVAAIQGEGISLARLFREDGDLLDRWVHLDGLEMLYTLPPFRLMDEAFCVSTSVVGAEYAAVPYHMADYSRIEERIDAMPAYCLVAQICLPAVHKGKQKIVEMIARSRLARAGLLTQAYWAEHSVFPTALSQVAGLQLTDPFSGTEFLFAVDVDQAVIYSVGPNRSDDGGDEDLDIIWKIYGE